MGRFDTIKTTIDANIKTNGNQEITGQKLNSVLNEMVYATDAELTELESEVGAEQSIEYTNNAINGITGEPYPTSQRLTSSFVVGKTVKISIANGKYVVYAYNDNGYISESGWQYTSAVFTIADATKYRIVLAKNDDANISPSEVGALGFKIDTSANASVLLTREQLLNDDTKEMVRKNIGAASNLEIGTSEEKIYTSSILTNEGYIETSGAINKWNVYAYSDKISVYKGQEITATSRQSSSVLVVAFYDSSDNFIRGLAGNSSVEYTESTIVEEGIAYMRMSHLVGSEASFKVVASGYGLKNMMQGISETVATSADDIAKMKNSINALSTRPAGDFYLDAWVRYSDGLIAGSAGGAKLYIIKKRDFADATRVYARVCTEDSVFAAIAFYSAESPSTESYMQSASVIGKKSTESVLYEADIPKECQSIVILNMSQHQADYDIYINAPNFLKKEDAANIQDWANSLFNPFSRKNAYYHFNQENEGASGAYPNTYIPAQSLFDVAYAASLGFDMIEANIHPCSDGVFITKHGSNGNFGRGLKSNNGVDYSDIAISSISSADVREHITYDSIFPKYNVPIPTLDEFCKACKQYNLAIKTEFKEGALPILRKYFSDDKIFLTYMKDRGDFRGLVEMIWNPSDDMETFAEQCKRIGSPIQIIIASGVFQGLNDESVKNIAEFAHNNGYTIAVPYLSTSEWLKARSLGIDVCLSTARIIPTFLQGNSINISDMNDERIELGGASSYNAIDDTLEMRAGDVIRIPANNIKYGAVGLDICYKGSLSMIFGHYNSDVDITNRESDGMEVLSLSLAITPQFNEVTTDYYVMIVADADTIIKKLNVRCSIL